MSLELGDSLILYAVDTILVFINKTWDDIKSKAVNGDIMDFKVPIVKLKFEVKYEFKFDY